MDLAEHIKTGHEFLLAYATQGRPAPSETGPGSHPRHAPEGMLKALVQLSDLLINRPEPIERLIAKDCQRLGLRLPFSSVKNKSFRKLCIITLHQSTCVVCSPVCFFMLERWSPVPMIRPAQWPMTPLKLVQSPSGEISKIPAS